MSAGVSPQTQLAPKPLAGFKGAVSRQIGGEWRREKGRIRGGGRGERKRRGEGMGKGKVGGSALVARGIDAPV